MGGAEDFTEEWKNGKIADLVDRYAMSEVDVFSLIDSDGSGTISREELERAITQKNIDKSVVQKLFDVFDQNEDGQISREEAYAKVFAKDPYDENLIKKFHELDDNGETFSMTVVSISYTLIIQVMAFFHMRSFVMEWRGSSL